MPREGLPGDLQPAMAMGGAYSLHEAHMFGEGVQPTTPPSLLIHQKWLLNW
jgi:hypothetical protein